jgi:hypothetical protein
MTTTSYSVRLAAIVEYAEIHAASCRYRKQGLVCSTCGDLNERAERASSALAQIAEAA